MDASQDSAVIAHLELVRAAEPHSPAPSGETLPRSVRNPFHGRSGSDGPSEARAGVHLSWADVRYSVSAAKGGRVTLLHGVTGQVAPGQLLAVMGASGAGKSTFLNVLAQRVRGYEGSIRINGAPIESVSSTFHRLHGYVTQDAPFLDTLTVRETLTFAAMLRLPESIPHAEKLARVDDILEQLDLVKCASTYVGKATEPGGISGGERRRLTLAMELIYDPYVLLVDEVTSGLDSSSAIRIMHILKELAVKQHRTVVCTIHQPRADLLTMFDNLLLLSGGRTVYFGPTWHPGQEDGMLQYFRDAGHPFSPFENPADALLDLVHSEFEYRAPGGAAPSTRALASAPADASTVAIDVAAAGVEQEQRARRDRQAIVSALVQRYETSTLAALARVEPSVMPPPAKPRFGASGKYATSWFTQFSVITRRSFLYKLRAPDAVMTQFIGSVVVAIIVGSVYWKLPLSQSGMRDRMLAIAFLVLTQSFMAFDLVVLAPYERAIMLRDTASGMYSSGAFYWGRTAAEAPVHTLFGAIVGIITYWMFGLQADGNKFALYVLIMVLITQAGASLLLLVGSMSKTMAAGNALATIVLVMASLFNGSFISSENIPVVYRWISDIAFPAFGVRAAISSELHSLTYTCSPDEAAAGCVGSGLAFLRSLGLDNVNIAAQCGFLLLEIAIMRLLAFLCMHFLYTGQTLAERARLLLPGGR